MKTVVLFALLLLVAQGVQAQQIGTCRLGSASADLDAGDVRARLYNNGGFFWRGSGTTYEVPKDGGVHSAFAAGLWIAGLAPDNTLHFTGTKYGPWEYWPGPLDANGNPPDDCADYDRMYSVYDADIRAYETDGTLTDDLRDWPHHLGAPVVDGDGVDGNYNLGGGDRPAVYGEQSVWWVMNDVGNAKEWSVTPATGLEVQVHAFAAACVAPGGQRVPQADPLVNQNTYYHFTVIHKGSEPLSNTYIGWWTDTDLGNAADDFVGSDTTLQMMYYYNGNDFDAGTDGYGEQPPAIGYLLAEGVQIGHLNPSGQQAPSERIGFTNIMMYDTGTSYNNTSYQYGYMQSLWPSLFRNRQIRAGGYGFGLGTPLLYSYPGDPVTGAFWSEEQTAPTGSFRNNPSDRNMLASSGPFTLAPGDTTDFTLAIVWARGQDRLDSVRELRRSAARATDPAVLGEIMTYDAYTCAPPPEAEVPDPDALGYYLLRQNYPEPFSQQTTIRYEVIDTVPVQLNVYDLLGRRVRTLVEGMQDAGVYDVVFEAGDLPTGTYFYRLEAAGYVSITRRMVLQR